jgi:hypothetical protein
MLDRITFIDRIILSTIENLYQVGVPTRARKLVFLFQNYLYNPLYDLGLGNYYDDREGFLGYIPEKAQFKIL